MARTEARLHIDLWREGLDGLGPHAKLMYCVLLTEPTLNLAGVGAVRVSRWARNASLTDREAAKALGELVDGGWIVVDEDTEEVLVRTLIRNDGIVKQPYMLKGALAQAVVTKSGRLRGVLAGELRKLPPRKPDAVSGKTGRTVKYPDPHAVADELDPRGSVPPPERVSTPSENPSETLFEPSGDPPRENPFEREGGRGSTSPTQELVPSTAHAADPKREEHREDVESLCEHLRRRIVGNGSKPPADSALNGWRRAARLLLDKDGRDLAEAHRLIDWCQDDDFWCSNIGGMPKFREQYDKLRLRAKANPGRPLALVPERPALRSFEDYRAAAAGREAARLLGIAYIPDPQPPSDATPPQVWAQRQAVEWIDAHEAKLRSALASKAVG